MYCVDMVSMMLLSCDQTVKVTPHVCFYTELIEKFQIAIMIFVTYVLNKEYTEMS